MVSENGQQNTGLDITSGSVVYLFHFLSVKILCF